MEPPYSLAKAAKGSFLSTLEPGRGKSFVNEPPLLLRLDCSALKRGQGWMPSPCDPHTEKHTPYTQPGRNGTNVGELVANLCICYKENAQRGEMWQVPILASCALFGRVHHALPVPKMAMPATAHTQSYGSVGHLLCTL